MDKIKISCYEYNPDTYSLVDHYDGRVINIGPKTLIELVHQIEEKMKEDNYYE